MGTHPPQREPGTRNTHPHHGQTHPCENITFLQLFFATGDYLPWNRANTDMLNFPVSLFLNVHEVKDCCGYC